MKLSESMCMKILILIQLESKHLAPIISIYIYAQWIHEQNLSDKKLLKATGDHQAFFWRRGYYSIFEQCMLFLMCNLNQKFNFYFRF